MAKLKITQTRSSIGQSARHRGTLRALGLGKIGRSVEKDEEPEPEPVATPASEATGTTETKDDGEAEDHADA